MTKFMQLIADAAGSAGEYEGEGHDEGAAGSAGAASGDLDPPAQDPPSPGPLLMASPVRRSARSVLAPTASTPAAYANRGAYTADDAGQLADADYAPDHGELAMDGTPSRTPSPLAVLLS